VTNAFSAPAQSFGATVILTVPKRTKDKRPMHGQQKRLHARAIKRIYDRRSRQLVGWLYEWNTGELVPRWKANAHTDVIYD